MTDRYEVTYEVPPEMLRRAMTSWARPVRPWWYKLLWIAGLFVIGAGFGLILTRTGLLNSLPDGMLLGILIGFYIGLTFWLVMHKRDVGRLGKMSSAQIDKQGPTQAVFTPDGVQTTTQIATATSTWAAYDQVIQMADATALRSGGVIYPIPHAALPDGVDPATFHADLCRWLEAGQ